MPLLLESHFSYGTLDDKSGVRNWSSIVGIVTAIIGNVLISFALNTQRYAHIRIDREYRDKQDPEAKQARKNLPKTLRNYGTAVQQEEAAEERQRINEEAPGINDQQDQHKDADERPKGKRHTSDETLRNEDGEEEEDHGRKSYLKSPWWWLGIILMTIGETGNFLAYGFAPASIVSPLGVVALVSNCLIAPLMLKERFRQRDFWGVMIAIGGAVTVVLSAKTSEKQLGPDGLWCDIKRWEFLAYVLITAVFIVLLMFASPRYGQRTIMIDLGLVGLFGGYTALSTKGVASLLSTSLYKAFEYPILYVLVLVLVASAVMQIRYLNKALQNFDSTQVIPVQFVLFTLSVITGSAVLYRDFERTDVDHALKFIFGCLLTFGGVYLITSGRKNAEEEDYDEEGEDAEQIRLFDEEHVDEQQSPFKQERETLMVDTDHPLPQTPRGPLSRTSSAVPSISVTPAASGDDLIQNPWLSSTDHLARVQSQDDVARPQTPVHQTLASASTTQTPFFTPQTSQRRPNAHLDRSVSSPAQPETPTLRAASPPKVTPADHLRTSRNSITRLLPGPILQPLSSSLSGIAADHILRGEGTSSPTRLSIRRYRSNREAARIRPIRTATGSEADLEAGISSAFASETSIQRAQDASRARAAVENEDSPLLRGSGTNEEGLGTGFGDNSRKTKGRLRAMSETLTGIMGRATGRRGSKDEGSATNVNGIDRRQDER